MRAVLEIRLLGQLRLTFCGEPWKFVAPPKALPLLAYLLLNRGATIRRETVAGVLWPDETEEAARANLRRHLHRLTQALPSSLGRPWIVSSGATIIWNPSAAMTLDIDSFERFYTDEAFASAAELYGGDLLNTLDEEWIAPERQRLHALYVRALERLLDASRAEGNRNDILSYGRRLIEAEPWREDALRSAMTALYENGDRAAALAEYEAFARRLSAEFGAEPATQTRALHEVMRRDQPLAMQYVVGTASGATDTPLLKREDALALADEAWQRAEHASGKTLLFGGEAGCGKTRLARELALSIESRGGRVLVGTTTPRETQPYQAIRETLRSALPSLLTLDLKPLWLGALTGIVPDLAMRAPHIAQPPRLGPEAERRRLFDAVSQTYIALAAARPILLVLEDLHWAGAATLELFERIARVAAGSHILIVATYRDNERSADLERVLRSLRNDGLTESVPLAPLDRQSVALLAELVVGTRDVNVDRLVGMSAGNPLFVMEALQSLRSGQALSGETLQHLVADRLERIPETIQAFAGAASVLSGGFELEIVRDVCGWSETATLEALDILLDERLIAAGTPRSRSAFSFVHELVQQIIYERTALAMRELAHRRAARALARVYADRLDEIAAERALHLERARLTQDAAIEYLRAARYASTLYAHHDVIEATERGLALAPPADVRFELLKLREATHVICGDIAAATQDLAALERCAQGLEDALAFAETLKRAVAMHHGTGNMEMASAIIPMLEAVASHSGSATYVADAKLAAATHMLRQGRIAETTEALRAALSAYQSIDDRANQALVLGQLAEIAALAGDAQQSEASAQASRTLAEALVDRKLLAAVLGHHARATHHLRRYRELRTIADELLTVAREIGDVAAEAQAHTSFASASVALFDLDVAEQRYIEAAALHERIENRLGSAIVAANRGALRGRVADWETARRFSAAARATFADLGDLPRQMSTAFNESQMALELGNAQEALELARLAHRIATVHGGAPLEAAAVGLIGICERRLHKFDDAIAHLQSSVDRSRHLPNATERASIMAELALTLVDAGRLDEAMHVAGELEPLDAARDDWEQLSHPQIIPWAAHRVYAVTGECAKAISALECARTVVGVRLARIANRAWRRCYETWQLNASILAGTPN